MAYGGAVVPGWQATIRTLQGDKANGGSGGGGSMAASVASGGIPGGEAGGWVNQLYNNREAQLRAANNETWREVAAARGLDPTDGPIVQGSNSSLADQIGQLDNSRLQALISLAGRAREDELQRQKFEWEQKQYKDQLESQRRREMANLYGQQPQEPFDSTYGMFAGMGSNTGAPGGGGGGGGEPIGNPDPNEPGFGQPGRLLSHQRPPAPLKYQPGALTETRAQAEARGARLGGTPGASPAGPTGVSRMFDYSGSSNNGGHLVPGIGTAGPSVSSLQGATAGAGTGSMAGGMMQQAQPQPQQRRAY